MCGARGFMTETVIFHTLSAINPSLTHDTIQYPNSFVTSSLTITIHINFDYGTITRVIAIKTGLANAFLSVWRLVTKAGIGACHL